MDVVPSGQLGHRRLFAESLQRDFRLQLSRVAPSLSWHSRFLLSDLDSTLTTCPKIGDHLYGVAERFIRTLKENLLWGRSFETIEELRLALREFKRTDTEQWMLEKYAYRSPARVRRDLVGLDAAA